MKQFIGNINTLKTRLLIFLLLFLICFKKPYAQSYSIRAGLNASTTIIEDSKYLRGDLLSPHAGIMIDYPLVNDALSVETGLMLMPKGYKHNIKKSVSFDVYTHKIESKQRYYLDIPISLKVGFDYSNVKIYGTIGSYFGIGLFKRNKLYIEDYFLSYTDVNYLGWYSCSDNDVKLLDYGISSSIGVEINSFSFSILYNLGLANITRKNTDELKMNNRLLALTVGYTLGSQSIKTEEKQFFSSKTQVGIYTRGLDNFGFLWGNTLNYRLNEKLLSVGYYHLEEFVLCFSLFGSGCPRPEEYRFLGIYVGKRSTDRRFVFDNQIGIGIKWKEYYVWNQYSYSPSERVENQISTVSLNLKSEFKFFAGKYVALGIGGHLSISKFGALYALPLLSIEYGIIK